MDLLDGWDSMTNDERRAMSSNAHFWNKKYRLVRVDDDDKGHLVEISTMKPVVTEGNLFDMIKDVHVQSECAVILAAADLPLIVAWLCMCARRAARER
jgi:hypothetical protein